MFAHVPPYAGDPILSLNEAFHKDPRADKVNLSIGIYFDEAGKIPALASVREVEKRARRLSLMELTERTCKWPIGDPATDDFWFCGLPTQAGKPYCDAHVGVAFQPMSARRDRRR
jgi:GcrA cell cycle regulator